MKTITATNITATYADAEKTAVNTVGRFSGVIPREHRFWRKFGIDELERNGQILPFKKPKS